MACCLAFNSFLRILCFIFFLRFRFFTFLCFRSCLCNIRKDLIDGGFGGLGGSGIFGTCVRFLSEFSLILGLSVLGKNMFSGMNSDSGMYVFVPRPR